MNDVAVSNSGPLIHLAEIYKFDLLRIFRKIYIPRAVYDEVCNDETSKFQLPGCQELLNADNIFIIEVSNDDLLNYTYLKLQQGELEAIALAKKLGIKLFLTDDLDAREKATELGLEPHGSVGIIVRAYKLGVINLKDAERAIWDLYNVSSLFISKEIVKRAIETLRGYTKR